MGNPSKVWASPRPGAAAGPGPVSSGPVSAPEVDPSGPFAPFARSMREAGLPPVAIRTFRQYYERLRAGATGLLREAEIEPVDSLPDATALESHRARGLEALDQAVVLKLNGGLGTSMGMTRAKSLLTIKNGLSFLDVIARQVLHLREAHGCRLPLVLMNSFRTRDDTLAILSAYPRLETDLPLDFLQHRVPRILADDLSPVLWPDAPAYEWCPPGHGDLYTALFTSGMLETLLGAGYVWAFVSNSDNLGAVLDPAILGWVADEEAPFTMEATDRTESDRKGGHLCRRADGRLALRESAQCAPDEKEAFADIERHRFFNTNNLWIDLRALDRLLRASNGVIDLPMIRNEKHVDPQDPDSPRCFQLETAMGAAISVFEGARALRVPRHRFAPVKTTGDLLAVRSDATVLTDDFRVVTAPDAVADPAPRVELDPAFYQRIDQLEDRFPEGAPSLVACRSLTVRGDVRFGRDVVCRGDVVIENPDAAPRTIPDGATFE